mmetsp:Transcript_22261/g.58142  ORF Transcript_22261/g.58142 Transcript_22261/m.58142 type:complete len:203 (-) Transcript_22261:740-1348(-)
MLCERGPSGKYLHKDQVYEPSRDSAITNAAWLWRAGKKGIPDYHDNMDSDGFMWWVKNRLVPAYRAVYQRKDAATDKWEGPKMVLVLDNAKYHHHTVADGINVNVLSRDDIVDFCERHQVTKLSVIREGVPVAVTTEAMRKTKRHGGANLDDVNVTSSSTSSSHRHINLPCSQLNCCGEIRKTLQLVSGGQSASHVKLLLIS